MDETSQIVYDNWKKLNTSQRRAFNVRINGEEHSAMSRNGVAQIHFPIDGQLMQVSELAFKLIINDGVRAGGSVDPTNDPTKNWAWGLKTYTTFEEWLKRYPVGSSVDVDGYYSCQCWDYQSAFWRAQANRNFFTGPNSYVSEAWTVSAEKNAGTEFELIFNWADIQIGDWVVWGGVGTGHDAIALSCPTSSYGTARFRDQNGQQGMIIGDNTYGPTLSSGNRFLGAWRYKFWTVPPCGIPV